MGAHYHAIRNLRKNTHFKSGDVLVLFGELFSRGYATGLVEEAERRGMKIIRSTVGRRDENNQLRALNAEEVAKIPQPFINIPLEAGFDLEPAANGMTPVDQLKDAKLSTWADVKMDHDAIHQSQKQGQVRFRKNVKAYLQELAAHIPPGANVLFAHLMAGGVPRTKIVMPLMNRSLKGSGDRYLPSQKFWDSEIGKFVSLSFNDVTAGTFDVLLQESTELREKLQAKGAKVSYVAYGYHGTEVLMGHDYLWQTYTPYLQGWAKMQLENLNHTWSKRGVTCAVYNCPEILTNSSSIFQGVEVSLYPLVGALMKEGAGNPKVQKTLSLCQDLLKPDHSFADMLKFTDNYLADKVIRAHCDFEHWPQHSSKDQLELMLQSSDHLFNMHKDPKNLLTGILSEVVFAGCGRVMMNDAARPESPVAWINHDILAKVHASE